jgi:hypothetical protein
MCLVEGPAAFEADEYRQNVPAEPAGTQATSIYELRAVQLYC